MDYAYNIRKSQCQRRKRALAYNNIYTNKKNVLGSYIVVHLLLGC